MISIYLKFLSKPHLLLLLYICLHPKTEIVTARFSLYFLLQQNSSIPRFLLHHFPCVSFATIRQSFLPRKFSFPTFFCCLQKRLLLQIFDFILVIILITQPITWKKSFFRSKRRFFHLNCHEIISVWRKRNLRFQMKEPPLSRKESPL